jgi:hypothetical protein
MSGVKVHFERVTLTGNMFAEVQYVSAGLICASAV